MSTGASYREIFDASVDAILVLDWNTGAIRDANRHACDSYGYTREELLQLTCADLNEPTAGYSLEKMQPFFLAAREDRCEAFEWHRRNKDGSLHWDEVHLKPVRIEGKPCILAFARDISARRAAESARAALEAQLRQAQKMEAVGQLTGGIAHDFNNILTSVMGYVVLAQERAERYGDATLVRQLDQANLAAQRARDLIAQMLAFSRRETADLRPIAMTPLVRQGLSLLRSTLPSSVTLDARWPDAIAGADEAWAIADPVQIEQVLFNLCINARDAMSGAGRITVRLGTHDGGHGSNCASCRATVEDRAWTQLSVTDTGSGVAPEIMDRLFDPFFSTKAPGEGSGMGLAMVHGIVHHHGGHILVDTAPGRGTTFTVLLPRVVPDAGGAAAVKPSPPRLEPLAGRILLVEDDVSAGEYLRERLIGWGLQVTLLRNPGEALELLKDPAVNPHALVTDLTMPRMTGLELARDAMRLRPGLPVLLLTGHAGDLRPADLARSGITRMLRKPVEQPALHLAMRELLGARSADQAARGSGTSGSSGTA